MTWILIGGVFMCRNIKTLFNFEPGVTAEEVQDASLQFVRKITGFHKPSKTNEAAFVGAVREIAGVSLRLLQRLETNAPRKNRDDEQAKARVRGEERRRNQQSFQPKIESGLLKTGGETQDGVVEPSPRQLGAGWRGDS
jgi:hypothetical protein